MARAPDRAGHPFGPQADTHLCKCTLTLTYKKALLLRPPPPWTCRSVMVTEGGYSQKKGAEPTESLTLKKTPLPGPCEPPPLSIPVK